jgi:NAD+ diphosphatase
MLGFLARADERDGGTEIEVDGEELSEARWFSREELREAMEDGSVMPPGGISIARRLIELWYGGPLPEAARW